jgi:SOS response regulatory protein OraA/RecX
MSATAKQGKYWGLRDLAQRCPGTINKVKITGNTRLLLWCLTAHCSGDTNSTWVGLDELLIEVACSPNPLDNAIAALKRSGLLSDTQQHFDPKNQSSAGNATRTINRALLEAEVARAEAESQPKMVEKKREKECKKMLKSLSRLGQATYGPASREEAKVVRSILNKVTTFPLDFTGQVVSPERDGQEERMMVIVSRKGIAPGN